MLLVFGGFNLFVGVRVTIKLKRLRRSLRSPAPLRAAARTALASAREADLAEQAEREEEEARRRLRRGEEEGQRRRRGGAEANGEGGAEAAGDEEEAGTCSAPARRPPRGLKSKEASRMLDALGAHFNAMEMQAPRDEICRDEICRDRRRHRISARLTDDGGHFLQAVFLAIDDERTGLLSEKALLRWCAGPRAGAEGSGRQTARGASWPFGEADGRGGGY